MNLSRRGFLTGLGAALAAPVVVKAEILMPIKSIIPWYGGIIDEIMWYAPAGLTRGKIAEAQWQYIGANLATSIDRMSSREGFMRRVLARGEIEYGGPILIIRKENVNATFS